MSSVQNVTRLSRNWHAITVGLAFISIVGCHHQSGARLASPANDVNVGYGERSRNEIGGSVPSMTLEDNPKAVSRVEQLLIGRFPGVYVLPMPNGGYSVRIRVAGNLASSQEPLYVVDGMAIEVTPGLGLNWMNPADVARIDVLKNPTETSMYGVRGANGVILITTKRR